MVASQPADDRSRPVRSPRTAVLRPPARDDGLTAGRDGAAERSDAIASTVDSSALDGSALDSSALDGSASGAAPLQGARRRRQILVTVSVVCLVALAAFVAGVLIPDDPVGENATPGLRLVTVPDDGRADDGFPGPAEAEGAAEGQSASAGPDERALEDDQGAAVSLEEGLLDGAPQPTDPPAAVPVPEGQPTGGAYPAPPVTEEPVVAVAEILSPSVVRIEIASGLGPGVGSGIVWDADNGYIVTNQHVVQGVSEVTVRFSDGTQVDGEVVGGSSGHDVAVVRVNPEEANLVAATFAPTSSVRVGQLAIAIGSPFGLTGTVTAGIVSAVRIQGGGGSDPAFPVPVEMIQTDAAINRGNSGGALADWRGRVVGMNTFIQTTTGGSIGLGFAVPSDTVELIATRVISGESLELGYLGISSAGGNGEVPGVPVTEVVPDSPAAEAGLQPGDVILSMEGEEMYNISELSAAIKLRTPGETVELELERDGDRYIATVVLGAWE